MIDIEKEYKKTNIILRNNKNSLYNVSILGKAHANIRYGIYNYFEEFDTYYDIVKYIYDSIEAYELEPAFPVGISINNQAAHYTYNEDMTKKVNLNDLITIDFGIQRYGHIVDCAFSYSKNYEYNRLCDCSLECLNTVYDNIGVDMKVCDIGEMVNEVISSYGYYGVKGVMGHSIGEWDIHSGILIPCYNNGDETKIKDNSNYALEFFVCDREPNEEIDEKHKTHFRLNKKNMFLWDKYCFDKFYKYKTLPFPCFDNSWKPGFKNGSIISYPGIRCDGPVAQYEHTIGIYNGKKYNFTKGDDY